MKNQTHTVTARFSSFAFLLAYLIRPSHVSRLSGKLSKWTFYFFIYRNINRIRNSSQNNGKNQLHTVLEHIFTPNCRERRLIKLFRRDRVKYVLFVLSVEFVYSIHLKWRNNIDICIMHTVAVQHTYRSINFRLLKYLETGLLRYLVFENYFSGQSSMHILFPLIAERYHREKGR